MGEDIASEFRLDGKTVMVTGAGRGLGRAVALACAAAGADIIATIRDARAAAGFSEEVAMHGRRCLVVPLDIERTAEIEAAVARATEELGEIDVLVNNVGISRQDLAKDVKEVDFDAILSTNLKGTFFLSQAVGRRMIARGSGRIINMSSQAGTVTLRGEAIYCMSKAALNHLTRCLAAEWGPLGVSVNSVSPTFTWTDSTRPYLSDPDNLRRTVGHIPLGRIGEPREVASTVVFLAAPGASLINGADILVDGGWSVS